MFYLSRFRFPFIFMIFILCRRYISFFLSSIHATIIVNGIYGNIANIFDIGKLYLNIIPNFTENKIKGSVRLHIKFRIIMIFKSIPIIIRIMLRKHRTKEGD